MEEPKWRMGATGWQAYTPTRMPVVKPAAALNTALSRACREARPDSGPPAVSVYWPKWQPERRWEMRYHWEDADGMQRPAAALFVWPDGRAELQRWQPDGREDGCLLVREADTAVPELQDGWWPEEAAIAVRRAFEYVSEHWLEPLAAHLNRKPELSRETAAG